MKNSLRVKLYFFGNHTPELPTIQQTAFIHLNLFLLYWDSVITLFKNSIGLCQEKTKSFLGFVNLIDCASDVLQKGNY